MHRKNIRYERFFAVGGVDDIRGSTAQQGDEGEEEGQVRVALGLLNCLPLPCI